MKVFCLFQWLVPVLVFAFGSAGAQTLAEVLCSVQERKLAIDQRAQLDAHLRGSPAPAQQLIEWTGLPVSTFFPADGAVDALTVGGRIALLNQALEEFNRLAPSYLNLKPEDLATGEKVGALRPFMQEDLPPLPRVDAGNFPVVLATFARQVRHLKVLPWVASMRQRERDYYASKWEVPVDGEPETDPESDDIAWQPELLDTGDLDDDDPRWLTVSASDPYASGNESVWASGTYRITTYHDGPPDGEGSYELQSVDCSQSTTFFSDARLSIAAPGASQTVAGKVAVVARTELGFLKAESFDSLSDSWNPGDAAFHVIALSADGGGEIELSATGPGIKAKLAWSALTTNGDVQSSLGRIDSTRSAGDFGYTSTLSRTLYPLFIPSFSRGLDGSEQDIPGALARSGGVNRPPAGDGEPMLHPRPGIIAGVPLGVGLDGDGSTGWIGISPGSYDFLTRGFESWELHPVDHFKYGVISPSFNSGAGYTEADLGIRFDHSANLRFVGAAEDFHVVYATGRGTDQRGASLPTAYPTSAQFSQSGWEAASVLGAWDLPRIRQIVGRDLIADVSIQGHYKTTVKIYRRPADAQEVDRTPGQLVSLEGLTPLRTLVFTNPNNGNDVLFPATAEAVEIADGESATYSVTRSVLAKDAGTIAFTGPSVVKTVTLTLTTGGARGATVATALDGTLQGSTAITGDAYWRWWGYRQASGVVHTAAGEIRNHVITTDSTPGCRGGWFARTIDSTGGSAPELSLNWDANGVIATAEQGPWADTTTAEGNSALKTVRRLNGLTGPVWATTWIEWGAGGRKVTVHAAPDGLSASMGGPSVEWSETEYGDCSEDGFPGLPQVIRNKDDSGQTFEWTVNADGSGQLVAENGLLDGNVVARGERSTRLWSKRGFVTGSASHLLLGSTLKIAGLAVPGGEFTTWGSPKKWKDDFSPLASAFVHDGQFSRLSSLTTPLGAQTDFSNHDALGRAKTVTGNGITANHTFTGLNVETDYTGTDIEAGTESSSTRDALGRLTASNTTWNGVVNNLGLTHGAETLDVSSALGPYGSHTTRIRQSDGSLEAAEGATLPFDGVEGSGISVSGGLLVSKTEVADVPGTYCETHTDARGRVRKVVTPSKSGAVSATTHIAWPEPEPESTLRRVITIEPSGRVLITESDPFAASGAVTRSGIDLNFTSVETANLGATDRYTESVTKVDGGKVVTTLKITEDGGLREILGSEWTPSTGVTISTINSGEEYLSVVPDWSTRNIATASSKGWSKVETLNNLGLPTRNTLSGTGIPTTELTPVWRADNSLASLDLEIGGETHSAVFKSDGTLLSLTVPGRVDSILGEHDIVGGVETLTVDGVTVESRLDGTRREISGEEVVNRDEILSLHGSGYKFTVDPAEGASTDTVLNAAGAATAKNYAAGPGETYGYEDELLRSVALARGDYLLLDYSPDGAKDLVSAVWPAVTSGDGLTAFAIPAIVHGFGYDRAARIDEIGDASGSRSLGYEKGRVVSSAYHAGALKGYEIIRHRDTTGRDTGFTLIRDGAVIHSAARIPNDVSDQIQALTSGNLKVVPQRDAAGRITGFEWGNATGTFVPSVTQTWQRGAGGRIEEAKSSGVTGAPSFDYLDDLAPEDSFDTRGRRLLCATAGGTWTYEYINGRLTNATHPSLGSFGYTFDAIGRRTDQGTANTTDLLNRTLAWTHDQDKTVKIAAHPDARVWVNGTEVPNFSGQHSYTITPPDANGGWVEWEALAILEGQGEGAGSPPANPLASPDAKAEKRGAVWVPPANESFAFDAAGNRESSAQWDYGWDAKNQLVRARTKNCIATPETTAAPQGWDLTFSYDSEGRLFKKHVVEYRDGARVSEKTITFLWDGWDLIYERHQLPSGLTTLERKYLWGPDIADGAAGGAGGLLLIRETKGNATQDLYPLYDGTGHVVALTNNSGALLASYAYGPFGELIHATGPAARANPWRYATKYFDHETGLSYFGHRYHDPITGQWLSREPLGETESVNLYSYCGNDPVNSVDVLGLAKVPINQADKNLIDLAFRYGLINENAGADAVIDTAILNSLLTANGGSPIVFEMGRTVVPCIVCHGSYAGGHIEGVSRLFSMVNGQVHSSTGNADMMRKIGAGAWGNTRALPGDIGNMIAMMANGSANAVGELAGVEIGSHPAFYQMPLDADGWRSAGQQQVYPGINGDNLMVGAGGALADAVFLFAGPEALAAKAPGWSVRALPRLNPANYRMPLGQLNMGFPLPSYVGPANSRVPATLDRLRLVAQQGYDFAVLNPRSSGLNRMALGKDAEIQATRWVRRWAERNDVAFGPGGLQFQVRGARSVPDLIFDPATQILDFKLTPKAFKPMQHRNFQNDFPGYIIEYIYGP